MRRPAALLAAVALAGLGGQAAAQGFIPPECRAAITASSFAPGSLEARWYQRFWTGDCGTLRGCIKGEPNWTQVVAELPKRAKPADRSTVQTRACRLGSTIGLEWARPKKVRRIDTGDLKAFYRTLKRAGEVTTGLDAVEAQVRAKLGR